MTLEAWLAFCATEAVLCSTLHRAQVGTRELAGARAVGVIDRVGGGLLIAAGARLALLRSR